MIDDVRLYNRSLSINEVYELFSKIGANAGPNQNICNEICSEVILDGRKSFDPSGNPLAYYWELTHRENSSFNNSASGETPLLSGLMAGIYDVTLTVTNNDNMTGTDTMVL